MSISTEVQSPAQFIAHLKIEKKVTLPPDPPIVRSSSAQPKEGKRQITEVTQMTIKAGSMEKLIGKLSAHIQLIEED